MEWILKYWIEWLFGILAGTVVWLVRQTRTKKKEYDTLKVAILGLLHDRLYSACSFYLVQGWCSVDDRENLQCLYDPYAALGGNGQGKSLYHKCLELPISSQVKDTTAQNK